MKKKIISLCLVLALAATAIVGASLAYFTDEINATNVFTTTNVKIQLIERQRNEDGTALEDFENETKVLLPIVGSAQGKKDQFGLPTAANYVDKIITIKNLKADAYVRLYYAIPEVLDNYGDASQNIIHVNDGNKFVAAGNKTDPDAINEDYTKYMGKETYVGVAVIQGIRYNVYYRDYNKVLTKDEETGAAFLVGLYMDKDVNCYTNNGKLQYVKDIVDIRFDFSEGVKIPVWAVGVQAAGFSSCAEAIEAGFNYGTTHCPWGLLVS